MTTINLVLAAIADLNETLPARRRTSASPTMPLFDVWLDSLETIQLAMAVERRVREVYGVDIELISEEAFSRVPSSVSSPTALANYIDERLNDATKPRGYKLIVADLDGTLWRGTSDEDGPENVVPCVELQSRLSAYGERGVLLAILSKNDERTALAVIDQHPDMVLRRQEFVTWRIDWNDKAENLLSVVDELGIGLDSVVFIDDQPAERARVRQALPMVCVPEWTGQWDIDGRTLDRLFGADRPVTDEDRQRATFYRTERRRDTLARMAQTHEEFLQSLALKATFEGMSPRHVDRALQLLNRANQMNARARRMDTESWVAWCAGSNRSAYVLNVTDRVGDYGLVGVASAEQHGHEVDIVDFALSCRALGRGLEEAFLAALVQAVAADGARHVYISCVPTDRNGRCQAWLAQCAGLVATEDHRYKCEAVAVPQHVQLVQDAAIDMSTFDKACEVLTHDVHVEP